ncbi:vacuolar amino acid transporter 1-like [Panicum miliaceum]|uniref:Vacuolar amino acid transporter 1-like n=1 Tax=Panicum miliaceum TaxID=4540 RepID=A0A3L6SRW8_PANMI|nr:vacuolar amino acid transporter 1-like [Panicum miliaceum]
MAAQDSPLDEPLLATGKDGDEDAASMEAQHLLRRDKGASFYRSCLNLSNGGWLSLALFALVGAVCYYTGQLAFGRAGRKAIGAVMYAELYLVAISFLILEGDNLDKLLPGTSVGLPGGYLLRGRQLFTLVVAVVILPTTWLRDLSVLAYVSAVGLVASAALTASLVWAGVAEPGFHARGGNAFSLAGLLLRPRLLHAFSLYFVCFSGHGVFPTVYTSMRNKKDFTKVQLASSLLCSLNYALTAVLGYLIYGDDVKSLVTLNLPSGKVYTRVAILTTLITPLAKAAISTAVLASTVVAACTMPFFGYLMSFIGSSLNVTVAVLFPCLSYLRIYVPRGGVRRAEVAAIVGILVVGVCVAVVGTCTSLHQIAGTF